jgi:thiamine biosynthesis lipoprotein ApbE
MRSAIRLACVAVTALAIGTALSLRLARRPTETVHVAHFEGVMGTSLDVRVQAVSDDAGRAAVEAALAEIARQSKILSAYDSTSEFSRWMRSRGVPTAVSPELIDVLAAFDEWRGRTGGALDPSAEALTRLWTHAAAAGRTPTAGEIDASLAEVRQRHWVVDRAASTAVHASDVPLALHSFTKSYVVDRAARLALARPGVSGILIDAGGDVDVRGRWSQTVAVADPITHADNAPPLGALAVRDAVVATSGGYKRGFEVGGRHYSHVLDPRTGQPTGHVLSATVVSADAIEAGALATAFCVLQPEESAALARTRPGVEFALVLEGGRRVESAGWSRLAARPGWTPPLPDPVATLYAAEQAASAPAAPLTVTLELARVGVMAKRPYVAVWIEDADKFPLRTVALWYDGKARFLPEMRAWYRADRLRAMAEGSQIVDAVTTATRPAGRYTIQWDGTDNAGKPVRAGAYTVCIEVSREHGTYQIVRQPIQVGGPATHVAVPPGTEISAASVDYQPAGRR